MCTNASREMVESLMHSTASDPVERSPSDLSDEETLVLALCSGSEMAFASLVEEHHAAMVRVASIFVGGHAAAEDVVQDVWLIVLRSIGGFQGRSSLKTWIFKILTNRAKTAGQRERRSLPLSTVLTSGWSGVDAMSQPENCVLAADALGTVRGAIGELPLNQRRVMYFRDIEGRAAKEVCDLLNLSESNQRVLLHRARAQVRLRMKGYHEPQANDEVA